MTHVRSQRQGFTLVEVIVVTAILAVITTTAAVALGKMFSISGKTRDGVRATETVRSALFELSAELRSSEKVQCKADEVSDILIYTYNGKAGDPHKPARQCTVRLSESGLVKEERSEFSGTGDPGSKELIVPAAAGFEVKCLTDRGWTSEPRGGVYAVSLSARIISADGPGRDEVYTTAVNVPRTLWQGGAPLEEVEKDV